MLCAHSSLGFPMRVLPLFWLSAILLITPLAQAADQTCPIPTSSASPSQVDAVTGAYALTVEKEGKQAAFASADVHEGVPTMMRMTVVKTYVAGHHVDSQGVIEVIPGTSTENFNLRLTAHQVSAPIAQADFELETDTVARIEAKGNEQVPVMEHGGPLCGSLSFEIGQARQFVIEGSSLTATLRRIR